MSVGLPWARQSVQPMEMFGWAEQRLRETIESALATGPYLAPQTTDTGERDRAYDDIAARLLAAIHEAEFQIEPPEEVNLLLYALRYGVMSYSLKPPGGDLAGYRRAVGASVLAQLARSGWSVDEGAVLRKAPPRRLHSTSDFIKRDDE
jgi:hypothetical protein